VLAQVCRRCATGTRAGGGPLPRWALDIAPEVIIAD